jgi:hypothetical protein
MLLAKDSTVVATVHYVWNCAHRQYIQNLDCPSACIQKKHHLLYRGKLPIVKLLTGFQLIQKYATNSVYLRVIRMSLRFDV